MDRRGFLAAGAALALAGCRGDRDDAGSGSPTTKAAATLETHPAARHLEAQPTLGPPPGEGAGTIVAFEDPSCPTCARFEREVVPQLRAELVEPGTVSYAFRGYPVVYDWGEPATRALEAVYLRDAAAHWALAAHYFDTQGEFRGLDPADVFDRTESFLASETDVHGAAAVDAARTGDADDAVATDLEAARDAGAGTVTPHLFLFRDGAFQTKSAGFTGMSTIRSVLGE